MPFCAQQLTGATAKQQQDDADGQPTTLIDPPQWELIAAQGEWAMQAVSPHRMKTRDKAQHPLSSDLLFDNAESRGTLGAAVAWTRLDTGAFTRQVPMIEKPAGQNRWRIVNELQAGRPGSYVRIDNWSIYQDIWPRDDRSGHVYRLVRLAGGDWQAQVSNPERPDVTVDLGALNGAEIQIEKQLQAVTQAESRLDFSNTTVRIYFDEMLSSIAASLNEQAAYLSRVTAGLGNDLSSDAMLAAHQKRDSGQRHRWRAKQDAQDLRWAPQTELDHIDSHKAAVQRLFASIDQRQAVLNAVAPEQRGASKPFQENRQAIEADFKDVNGQINELQGRLTASRQPTRPQWQAMVDGYTTAYRHKYAQYLFSLSA